MQISFLPTTSEFVALKSQYFRREALRWDNGSFSASTLLRVSKWHIRHQRGHMFPILSGQRILEEPYSKSDGLERFCNVFELSSWEFLGRSHVDAIRGDVIVFRLRLTFEVRFVRIFTSSLKASFPILFGLFPLASFTSATLV